jgi:hypothetical protein
MPTPKPTKDRAAKATTSPKRSTAAKAAKAADSAKPKAASATRSAASRRKHADLRLPEGVAAADLNLRTAAKLLGDAVAELHESENEAWRTYSADVADSVARVNAELEMSLAQVKAAGSDNRADLAEALREADEARRTFLDNLLLQTHLATMNAQDRTKQVTDTVNVIGERIERMVGMVLEESATTVKDLAGDVGELIANLRRAMRMPMR